MNNKSYKSFDLSTWIYICVNIIFFGYLILNRNLVLLDKRRLIFIELVILVDVIYLVNLFYNHFKYQYIRFKTRKLRFAMNSSEFNNVIADELNEIFKKYPINPYHFDIGEDQAHTRKWAVDIVINYHPYILDKSFYNIKNAKERERYRKSLRHFDTELFFIARDRYIDLVEGDHYKQQFEEALEQNTHLAMKEISKMVTRLFND